MELLWDGLAKETAMASNKKVINDVDAICEIVKKMTDEGLRIGQIFDNVFGMIAADGKDPFYVDDKMMTEYLNKYSK